VVFIFFRKIYPRITVGANRNGAVGYFCSVLLIYLVLLRSESPGEKCAKLHTLVASNNRVHTRDHSIIACSRHVYIWVLFFARIPFVVNRAFSAAPAEWLQ